MVNTHTEKISQVNPSQDTTFTNHLLVQLDLEKKGLLVISILFLFFGLSDLFSQIYIEEIIQYADPSLNVEIPKPSYEAIYQSIFSDVSTTGLIIAIFFGFRAFSSEITVDKQVYYFMSRPITRGQYYLTKSVLRSLGILIGIIFTSTIVYFLGMIYITPISFHIIFLSTVIVSFGVLANYHIVLMLNAKYNSSTTGVISGLFFITQFLISSLSGFITWLKWLSPISLSNIWSDILMRQELGDFIPNSIVLIFWIIGPLLIGNYWYTNRDL